MTRTRLLGQQERGARKAHTQREKLDPGRGRKAGPRRREEGWALEEAGRLGLGGGRKAGTVNPTVNKYS